MLVIMSVATGTRAVGAPAALAIAAAVGLAAIAFGPLTRRVAQHRALVRPRARVGAVAGLLGVRRRSAARRSARSALPTITSAKSTSRTIVTTTTPRKRGPIATALFVCLHDAGRSQMSAALFERAAHGRHHALSAGSEAGPDGRVHPPVVEGHRPKGLPVDEVRAIRDDIDRRVRELVGELDATAEAA